jgi:hypothetical protein
MAQKISSKKAVAKVVSVLLCTLLFLLLFSTAVIATMYGDVNGDGVVDVRDVVLVEKHVLSVPPGLNPAEQLLADVNGDGVVNVWDVSLIMQYSLGLITEFPMQDLSVSSVSAINPKQVEVVFDRSLHAEEKAKMVLANFHVGLHSAPNTNRLTGVGAAVAVLDDNKTILLTLGNDYWFTSGTATNKVVVKEEVGIDSDYTVANLSFIDSEVPRLVSVETISPTMIVMTFSEPLDRRVIGPLNPPTNIMLFSGAVPVPLNLTTNVAYIDSQRELRLNSTVPLTAGSYTLNIAAGTNLKDYTGYGVVPAAMTFTHTPITAAPTMSVKSSTETTVTLEFSRPIIASTLDNNTFAIFRHTYNTNTFEVNGFSAVTNPSGDNKTFVVNFGASKPLPPGDTPLWFNYVTGTSDANKVKDNWGNIVAPATFTINTVPDTNPPTATVTLVAGTNDMIHVQYSKPVTGGNVLANYSLRKGATPVGIFSVNPVAGSPNKYLLTTPAMVGVHTLTIANIKDTSLSQNPMGTQTYTIDVPDLINPVVNDVIANNLVVGDANSIYVYYSKIMGPSALDRNNYRLDFNGAQVQLPVGTVITDTASTIKITLPGTIMSYAPLGATPPIHLFIGNVKDLAGNSLLTMGNYLIDPLSDFNPGPTEVTLLSSAQISFKVNRHLQTVNAANIQSAALGGPSATFATFTNNTDGKATVTANFPAGTFDTYIPFVSEKINILAAALTDLNGFTNSVVNDVPITIDRAAPVLVGAKRLPGPPAVSITSVEVEYSENIYPASIQDTTFTVQGYTVNSVHVLNNKVTLSVSGGVLLNPLVTQVGSVQDDIVAPRNTLVGPQPAVIAAD